MNMIFKRKQGIPMRSVFRVVISAVPACLLVLLTQIGIAKLLAFPCAEGYLSGLVNPKTELNPGK